MKNKTLYIAVGAPGSGKTTTIISRINLYGGIHVSRDNIRFSLVAPEEKYFSHEGEVFNLFINQIQTALDDLNGPNDVYADATHLHRFSRKKLLDHLNLQHVQKIIVLYFHCPKEVLIQRNLKRQGRKRVPIEALEKMFASMDTPSKQEHPLFEIWDLNQNGEMI